MGNFFTSPQERAATTLYDAASSGRPMGADLLRGVYSRQLASLRGETSSRLSGQAGDIMSRLASVGAPSSATEGLVARAQAPVLGSEQTAEQQLGANEMIQTINLLLSQLSLGLSGLSPTSTFGNIMAGLTTLGNVAGGAGSLINSIKGIPSLTNNTGTKVNTATGGFGMS